jgi:hypothetical protein
MEHTESNLLLLLGAYAAKHNSAVITTSSFVEFVTAAILQKTNIPGIGSFLDDTKNKIYKSIDELIKDKLVFMENGGIEKVYFPSFYSDKIYDAYEHIDTTIETPFPNDTSLSIHNLQKHHVIHIDVLNSFTDFISKRDEDNKIQIVRMAFTEGYGSALAVSGLLPQKILQIAIFKLRDYLYRYGNNDFFLKKLKSYFSGKETLVMDYFKNITTTPEKSIVSIMSGNNFSTSFWSYLYSLVKSELQHQEILNGRRSLRDSALYQSCTIILACNNYYTTIALNERDKVLTFSAVEEGMDKPPYYYTFDEIKSFKTGRGQNILHSYSVQELAVYIKQKLKSGDDNMMPSILVFHGLNKEIWYAKKNKVINLCARLVAEASPLLRKCIEERWHNMLKDYYTENTMRDDFVFEELIRDLASENMPQLSPILREPKLEFVLEELRMGGEQFPMELFNYGEPLPLRKILGLDREAILFSIRAGLPLRYSIRFIAKIIGFLRHGTNSELIFTKKTKQNRTAKIDQVNSVKDMHNIDILVKSLIPEGNSMDDELDSLAEKWNQLLNKTAREKLRKNVNEIINANLIFELKTLKFGSLTVSIVEDIARSLIASNEVLKNIHDNKALCRYTTLFIFRLMKTREISTILKKRGTR